MALYVTRIAYGATELHVDGWNGWVRMRPTSHGWTLVLRRPGNRVSYTDIAGNVDVVRSVAETMIRGAARADGIEVQS